MNLRVHGELLLCFASWVPHLRSSTTVVTALRTTCYGQVHDCKGLDLTYARSTRTLILPMNTTHAVVYYTHGITVKSCAKNLG